MILKQQAFHPVKRLCVLLSVSRRGFYAWLNRRPGQRGQEDKVLGERILALHLASRKTYVNDRIKCPDFDLLKCPVFDRVNGHFLT